MRLELQDKITQVPSGCEQNGPHHCRYPRIHSIMWTPGPLSQTYAVLDWVLASKTFGLGVGYGQEWNSRLETLKLDSRIRLLTVFKLSSVAHCIGWEPKKNERPADLWALRLLATSGAMALLLCLPSLWAIARMGCIEEVMPLNRGCDLSDLRITQY